MNKFLTSSMTPDAGRHPPIRTGSAVLMAALCAGALSACAPDAWRSDPQYDNFINQVETRCKGLRIGSVIIYPNAGYDQYPYFLDITSRFYNGKISRDDYVTNISGAFNAPSDAPGIVCILGLMPANNAAAPRPDAYAPPPPGMR
jgi:hypothetical protein